MQNSFSKRSCKGGLFALVLLFIFTVSAFGQNFTIDGSTNRQAYVGDTLLVQYHFSGGDSVANAQVWIDFDHNSVISFGDYLMFETRGRNEALRDGAGDDEDGAKDGYYLTSIRDFFPMAPVAYIFKVMSPHDTSFALLTMAHRPSSLVFKGKVSVPANTERIFVFAHPVFPDTINNGYGKVGSVAKISGRAAPHKGAVLPVPRLFATGLRANAAATDFCDPYNSGDNPSDRSNFILATLTDANGVFEIPAPMGYSSYWVVGVQDQFDVLSGYYPPSPQRYMTTDDVTNLDFAFVSATAQVRGSVSDYFGGALVDHLGVQLEVNVRAYGNEGVGLQTRTVNGEFTFDVIAGYYWIEASELHELYLDPESKELSVADGDTLTEVDLHLLKLDSFISGRVTIGNVEPIRCAHVFAWTANSGEVGTYTDEQGYYRLPASTQADPWMVTIDTYSLPANLFIDGDLVKQASAGSTNVDFNFIRIDPGPKILSIKDILADQGLQVRIMWKGSVFDQNRDYYSNNWGYDLITEYGVWRRGPLAPVYRDSTNSGSAQIASDHIQQVGSWDEMLHAGTNAESGTIFQIAGEPYVWDYVARVPAVQFPVYSFVAPTLHDSTRFGRGWSFFMVSAHTQDPFVHYFSRPDSGYSVDNLPPVVRNIAARVTGNGVELSWETPSSPDVVEAKIYRSQTRGFTPAAGNLIGSVAENSFVDATGSANDYYRLVVTDDAGNTTMTDEVQPGTTGIVTNRQEGAVPTHYVLDQNYPNPFNPSTKISFGLPQNGHIRIAIFDALGRQVRTLVDLELRAGYYDAEWDGRDDAGSKLASGLYFYKLQTPNTLLQKKMLLAK